MQTQDISDDIRVDIERIVRSELDAYGITACDFYTDIDSSKEPIVVVELCYPMNAAEPISGTQLNRLLVRARTMMLEKGDDRFPHFRHWFAEGQAFKVM